MYQLQLSKIQSSHGSQDTHIGKDLGVYPSVLAIKYEPCNLTSDPDIQVQDRVSERARKTLELVAKFVDEECIPSVFSPVSRRPELIIS